MKSLPSLSFILIMMLIQAAAVGRSQTTGTLTDFETATGGYKIRIPQEWRVKESLSPASYSATLWGSRPNVSVTISRLRDYRGIHTFHSAEPAKAALALVQRIADERGKPNEHAVIELTEQSSSTELHHFVIVEQKGDTCSKIWVAVRIKEYDLFQAQWSPNPCLSGPGDASGDLIDSEAKSLVVTDRWGNPGA